MKLKEVFFDLRADRLEVKSPPSKVGSVNRVPVENATGERDGLVVWREPDGMSTSAGFSGFSGDSVELPRRKEAGTAIGATWDKDVSRTVVFSDMFAGVWLFEVLPVPISMVGESGRVSMVGNASDAVAGDDAFGVGIPRDTRADGGTALTVLFGEDGCGVFAGDAMALEGKDDGAGSPLPATFLFDPFKCCAAAASTRGLHVLATCAATAEVRRSLIDCLFRMVALLSSRRCSAPSLSVAPCATSNSRTALWPGVSDASPRR